MRPLARLVGSVLALATLTAGLAPPVSGQEAEKMRTEPWPASVIELAESLPVQDGGRIKPLHTFAGFTLLRLHGKRSLKTSGGERLSPVEWLLDTLFFPEATADYPLFLVQNDEVIAAIGIPSTGKKKRDYYSFDELRPGIPRLFDLAHNYGAIEEKERTSLQRQIYFLAGNVNSFIQLASHLDFARRPIALETSTELSTFFHGHAEVWFHEVVERAPELRKLHDELAADRENREMEEANAVMSLLRAASELSKGTGALALIPPAASPETEAWMTPVDLFDRAYQVGSVSVAHVDVLRGFQALASNPEDPVAFERELAALHARIRGLAEVRGEYGKIGLEITYYKSKVISWSLYLFVLAFLSTTVMWLRPRSRLVYRATSGIVLTATMLLIAAIVMRCVIRGRPPVSTLYETVLFVTAVGLLLALFIELVNRQRIALSAAAILGMVGLFIANGYEMLDKQDTMPSLVAVLDTNFWLATHVTAITIGYSAGMLAALLGTVYLLAKITRFRRGAGSDRAFYRNLSRMVYGVLCFGMIFATVGTILGGIWANDSWGRFWGWDPKENGALLIVISQIAILHGRMGGYLREHGICMAAALGGTVVAFSWWGVNLLGVGLHSYGFTSGINTALWTYYGIQWGIVGLGGVTWLVERSMASSTSQGVLAPLDTPLEQSGGVPS